MEVKLVVGKNGVQRAFKWSTYQMRWFPMPLNEAQEKLASGEASLIKEPQKNSMVSIPKDPFILNENGALVDVFEVFSISGNA